MGDDKKDKPTTMVLKVVDLHCCSCFKKVKKILCKFPQIRDQAYDEKANTVTITVVCCNSEKFRDKLYSKGCGVIKKIDIKDDKSKPPVAEPKPPVESKPDDKAEKIKKPTVVVIEKPKVVFIDNTGGPCCQLIGRLTPPPPCFDNYGPYGFGRGYYVSRCECFNDENATGCSIK